MNAMQQQGGTHLGDGGTGGTRAAAAARQPTFTALDPQRALTDRLMEQICDGPSLGLASLVVNMIRYNIEETAVYDKYVRWCGRTGPRGPIGVKIKNASQSGRRVVFVASVSEVNFVSASCFPPY